LFDGAGLMLCKAILDFRFWILDSTIAIAELSNPKFGVIIPNNLKSKI